MSLSEAKIALDTMIKKSRVHLYKPIQIAEILYRDRVVGDIDLENLETYRTKSKKWRADICFPLLGRDSTSSAKFQDDIFNAIPPMLIAEMGKHNRTHGGVVEAYIYNCFTSKHRQLADALNYCFTATKEDFNVTHFIASFWYEPGLKRSLDKIYEMVVYALFSTLIEALELTIEISISEDKMNILEEFGDFTRLIMCIDFSTPTYIQDARVYRVGVTNAADRGLDMYSNWGPAIQIKHLSLNVESAKDIVNSISSDKIIIVCKEAEKSIIVSLLTQIGWKSRIQSIVTEADLIVWYEKALRGKYSENIGASLIKCLCEEIVREFPSVGKIPDALKTRHYEDIAGGFWMES